MRGSNGAAVRALTAAAAVVVAATAGVRVDRVSTVTAAGQETALAGDLDRIFASSSLDRSLVAVRIQSLTDGRILYARNAGTRMIPASVMKIVTIAVAAERLGWDRRFESRLEATGQVTAGVLHGDLIVVGTGDPSIAGNGPVGAPLFDEWADALRAAGITRVSGRVIGDDTAFDDEPLGAGWAWDYLSAGYAAPSGALSYNENVVVIRIAPGQAVGQPATVRLEPAGHGLTPDAAVTTTAAGSAAAVSIARTPGTDRLLVRGQLPVSSPPLIRTSTVENPTKFFVEGFRLALAARGIAVTGGAWDIDDIGQAPGASGRRLVARRESPPLSSLAGYAMKVSQNYYGEMLLKAIGRQASGGTGSAERGRAAVRETLDLWKIPTDALVMYDGSGLSRYNYLSADLLVEVLSHAWRHERLRGPFVAALPVGGHDGTLEARMRRPGLDRHVQAKTGTINNVRSLAGYAETTAGEKLVFAMIANHFTAPNAQIDAVMDDALLRVVR